MGSIYGENHELLSLDVSKFKSQELIKGTSISSKSEPSLYEFAFKSCGVGMAIASLGGDIMECNDAFANVTGVSKMDACTKTLFNFMVRQHLDAAFEMISKLIINCSSDTIIIPGLSNNNESLLLHISLAQREDGPPRFFLCSAYRGSSQN
jgi:hypothetical protein